MSLVLRIIAALCFAIAILSEVASFNTNTLAWIAGGLLSWLLASMIGYVSVRTTPPQG